MSPVPTEGPRRILVPPAAAPPGPRAGVRPGWTEVVVGLLVTVALAVGLVRVVPPTAVGPVAFGLMLSVLSAVAAGAGFAVAAVLRVRSLRAFGVRRTTLRWLLVGLAGGIVAFVLKFPSIALYVALTGNGGNAQADFSAGAAGGVGATVLSIVCLAILTPIGEELLFRGILTTVLLRYGAVIGVLGSAVIFAVVHLAPTTVLAALAVGLFAAELRRRTDSIWPGVAVHITFNTLSAVLAFVVAPLLG